MQPPRAGRPRDAARSQEAILEAAEALFAERGFEGASLNEIALAAGLSRGTPSYFFGSKERLYGAVLERVFAARERATHEAFEPLVRWSSEQNGGSLQRALMRAVAGYLEFLLEHESFLRLIQQEELAGAERLRRAPRDSRAIADAFVALRSVAPRRGVQAFEVTDAVLLFVSLTFSPLAQRATFMASLQIDLREPRARRRHVRLVVDQLLHLILG